METTSAQLRGLSDRLKAMGDDGKGFKRKLYKAMDESVRPLAEKVASIEHLKPYMPDRYAEVLGADLTARVAKSFYGSTPRVEVIAKARQHKRKLRLLDAGVINHPIYARGERKTWSWSNGQTGGMKEGFFSDLVKDESPQIQDKILAAMTETANEIAGK